MSNSNIKRQGTMPKARPEMKSISDQVGDQIYKNLKQAHDDLVDVREFKENFSRMGILQTDPRAIEIFERLEEMPQKLTKQMLSEVIEGHEGIVEMVLAQNFIMPDFQNFSQEIKGIYENCKLNNSGANADYIPELANANPNNFGVSICTTDGQRLSFGDTKELFSVQSTSKPISYAIALEELGEEKVSQHVGVEPSGVSFNAITLNPDGLPHNPLINAGAIMIASLIKPELEDAGRFTHCTKVWESLAADHITYDNTVYLSERNTADTNFALAYLMKSKGAFAPGTDIQRSLQFYFMMCSLQADAERMSVIAGTLANGGRNPLTGEQVFQSETVKNVLSVMNSCGMYDYSGKFAFSVGLPAKSGVAGAVMLIVPGLMGVCTYAPPLDKYGNSAKGVQFATELSEKFGLHYFQINKQGSALIQNKSESAELDGLNMNKFCATGDLGSVKRLVMRGAEIEDGDYDGRTPLHLAASEGKIEIVEFLIDAGLQNVQPLDRWGNTPLADAKRGGHQNVVQFLQNLGSK